ncbi:LysR family transcriptional regulator [Psychrobium sp. 1_MG-2023]|uniref:LysR family transcriptional regulator n=1 Tax=Psychrobium sp. 1_MG-2023 TaxID=3062624 RepID=UPI000C34BEEC|nr:LysR family transcriptional regulator [Psychrobium sp. 1_MG-2023]MDP2559954.1 LysR family transcriptional regulator [Psychrobium sp. 1_MG-2023]PKF56380.1 LysR family transcriptional regulator [Alteromonadales bacterium alter-6D02]
MRLDIETLKILDLIVRLGSFAKAAEQLNRAQSAISYQIKKLEQHLGVALFDRSKYRAELTAEGNAILTEGRRLLQQAHNLEVLAERFSQGWEPRLEIIIDGALPMEPVMRALKRLSEMDVSTRVQLRTEFLSGVQRCFEKNSSDLMLVKDFQSNPYLNAKPLKPMSTRLVVAAGHPLASIKGIELKHLHEYIELTIADSGEVDLHYQDDLQFGGERVFYLNGFIAKKNSILLGLGYGWVPDYLIEKELANGELVELDFVGGASHSFTPKLVHSSERPLGRAGQLLSDLIIAEFGA